MARCEKFHDPRSRSAEEVASAPRLRHGVAAFLFAVAASAGAASPFDASRPSAGEFARLPVYCPHTLAYNGPDYQVWLARLGNTFSHIHHYCVGLLKANRAEMPGVPAELRKALYASAVQECYYVIDRAPKDFVLLPEIFYMVGTYFVRQEMYVEALDHFAKSKTAKADYWPPYVEAAKVHMRLKQREKALEWLREGLRHLPEEPQLVGALAEIEGRGGGGSGAGDGRR